MQLLFQSYWHFCSHNCLGFRGQKVFWNPLNHLGGYVFLCIVCVVKETEVKMVATITQWKLHTIFTWIVRRKVFNQMSSCLFFFFLTCVHIRTVDTFVSWTPEKNKFSLVSHQSESFCKISASFAANHKGSINSCSTTPGKHNWIWRVADRCCVGTSKPNVGLKSKEPHTPNHNSIFEGLPDGNKVLFLPFNHVRF